MEEYIQEILALIRSNKSDKEIKDELKKYHDSDIADVYEYLTDEEKTHLTKILGADDAADVLSYADDKDEFLDYVKEEQAADIIENMDADDAVDVLQDMPSEDREHILDLIDDKEVKKDIELIMSFDEEEIGSLMTTNYVTILENDGVKEAMRKVVSQASENDNISTIFVVTKEDKFVGALNLKDLIIARDGQVLQDKFMPNYPTLHAHDKIDDVINSLKDYAEDIIPVLNEEDKIIGVLTSDDIVQLVSDENTEDYHKLAGLTEQENEDESIWQSLKKRIPWLALLLVLGLIVSTVISAFEGVISMVVGAVYFQSVVFDMAGNGGTQSLAVTLTTITNDDDLSGKKIRKMMWKELRVGLLNGVLLGVLSFLVVFAFLCIRHQPVLDPSYEASFSYTHALMVSTSVGVALLIALSVSSLLGLLLPIFFKKIKIDPAVASGPMITTVNDICSACIYYTLVGLFFQCF